MSEAKFGEPWSYQNHIMGFSGESLGDSNDKHIGDVYLDTAARIVACVNAFEGIDDPAAELARLRERATELESLADAMAAKGGG